MYYFSVKFDILRRVEMSLERLRYIAYSVHEGDAYQLTTFLVPEADGE